MKILAGEGEKFGNVSSASSAQFRDSMYSGRAAEHHWVEGVFGYHGKIGELWRSARGRTDR